MGGGKGGSDFDPKGKSDGEIMRFCQSFMTELCKAHRRGHRRSRGRYRRGRAEKSAICSVSIRDCAMSSPAFLPARVLPTAVLLHRTEATGYGLCYFTEEMLKCMKNDSFKGKTVVVSGSGNVAIYATEKATQLGGKVVALSDSNGYVYDPNGIKLDVVKQIKEVERGRIKEYAERVQAVPSTTRAARAFGRSSAILLFPALRRTKLMKNPQKFSLKTA